MSYAIEQLPDRIAAKVMPVPESGCWIWLGSTVNGYGQVTVDRKGVLAHRYSYEFFKGAVPKDFTVDHLCFVKPCMNPTHLEAVSLKENILRGRTSPTAVNARKTHCQLGHPYETRSFGKRMARFCRTCKQVYDRKWRRDRE